MSSLPQWWAGNKTKINNENKIKIWNSKTSTQFLQEINKKMSECVTLKNTSYWCLCALRNTLLVVSDDDDDEMMFFMFFWSRIKTPPD